MPIIEMCGFDVDLDETRFNQTSKIVVSSDSGVSLQGTGGRFDGGRATMNVTGTRSDMLRLTTGYAGLAGSVAFWYRPHTLTLDPTAGASFVLFNSTTASSFSSSDCHGRLLVRGDGSMAAQQENAGALVEVFPPGTINQGSYYWIAVYIEAANSGRMVVRVNNVVVEVMGDFYRTGSVLNVQIRATTDHRIDVDDMIVADEDLTALTPRRILTQAPSADRSAADFTPSSGSDGYAMLNDLPANAGTYVHASSVGDTSEFELSDIDPALTAIHAIKMTVIAQREPSGGLNEIDNSLHLSDATEIAGVSTVLSDGVWDAFTTGVLEENPSTTSPFTAAEVNGLYTRHEVV